MKGGEGERKGVDLWRGRQGEREGERQTNKKKKRMKKDGRKEKEDDFQAQQPSTPPLTGLHSPAERG